MSPFERHVFVCTTGKVCPTQGAGDVIGELRQRVKAAGAADRIRVNKAGCFAQCGHGPLVVVYPENVWYAPVSADDARVIFEEHLMAGQPVERLRYCPAQPGKNICPQADS